jgi:hypothetical protein
MSGTSLLRPRSLEAVEASYTSIVSTIAPYLSAEQQVQQLAIAPAQDLAKGRIFALGPVVDADLIPSATTFASLENWEDISSQYLGLKHCERLMIGDCAFDVCFPCSPDVFILLCGRTYGANI